MCLGWCFLAPLFLHVVFQVVPLGHHTRPAASLASTHQELPQGGQKDPQQYVGCDGSGYRKNLEIFHRNFSFTDSPASQEHPAVEFLVPLVETPETVWEWGQTTNTTRLNDQRWI